MDAVSLGITITTCFLIADLLAQDKLFAFHPVNLASNFSMKSHPFSSRERNIGLPRYLASVGMHSPKPHSTFNLGDRVVISQF